MKPIFLTLSAVCIGCTGDSTNNTSPPQLKPAVIAFERAATSGTEAASVQTPMTIDEYVLNSQSGRLLLWNRENIFYIGATAIFPEHVQDTVTLSRIDQQPFNVKSISVGPFASHLTAPYAITFTGQLASNIELSCSASVQSTSTFTLVDCSQLENIVALRWTMGADNFSQVANVQVESLVR